ncbi:MAG: hypothetical protein ACOX6H_02315 [Christensenellales bacterium]|jgi:hypothetical protein
MNILSLTQEQLDELVKNTRELYSLIFSLIKQDKILPLMQIKHERIYAREAQEGESVFDFRTQKEEKAKTGQYVVYKTSTKITLMEEEEFKKYEISRDMAPRHDEKKKKLIGYKIIDDLKYLLEIKDLTPYIEDINNYQVIFPSSTGEVTTLNDKCAIVFPIDKQIRIDEQFINHAKKARTYPQVGIQAKELLDYFKTEQAVKFYMMSEQEKKLHAVCDSLGTFKLNRLNKIADHWTPYLGQLPNKKEEGGQEF